MMNVLSSFSSSASSSSPSPTPATYSPSFFLLSLPSPSLLAKELKTDGVTQYSKDTMRAMYCTTRIVLLYSFWCLESLLYYRINRD